MQAEFPSQEDLIAYLRGKLPREEAAALDARLSGSASLRAELERTRAVLEILDEASEEATVRRANEHVDQAIRAGSSDLHIDLTRDDGVVRYRIDGVLHEMERLPTDAARALVNRLRNLLNMELDNTSWPQDGRFDVVVDDKRYDLRGCFMPGIFGGRLVIRFLSPHDVLFDFDRLGFFPEERAAVMRMIHSPCGLILCTGPTGSGKTTVLYHLIRECAKAETNCMSVEDPVELAMPWMAQTQINVAAGLTFPVLLRAIMRQDPDVVMVGEIRDLATAEMCLELALTGHLVVTTLHTHDSVGAIRRLIDMGIEPFLLGDALVGVVACRLVRVNCPQCTTEVTSERAAPPAALGIDPRNLTYLAGKGCEHCRGTGYRGRRGLYEVLEGTPALSDAIASNAGEDILRDLAFSGELPDQRRHAARMVREGITTPAEATRVLSLTW